MIFLSARPEDQIYYYHPDHLGTATFLTDGNGLPYEMRSIHRTPATRRILF